MMSEILYHHGILGMKWGVRRYQNPDGSLTEAGKKRYHTGKGNVNFNPALNTEQKRNIALTTRSPSVLYELADVLDDRELSQRYQRLSVESNIYDLMSRNSNKGIGGKTYDLVVNGSKFVNAASSITKNVSSASSEVVKGAKFAKKFLGK